MKTLLEMKGVVKDFPGARALDGVDFTLAAGEFHSLIGENGAGKSTLMKILSGVYPAGSFNGEVNVNGSPCRFQSVTDSASAGIAIIFQELSLIDELSVAENIFLGREPSRFGVVDWNELRRAAKKVIDLIGLNVDVTAKVSSLGLGQKQLVEIAKALSQDARILVLDEPTAALNDSEAEKLFSILGELKKRDVGLIYISHRLEEVFRFSDRITVLRDGRTVGSFGRGELDETKAIELMVGREIAAKFPLRNTSLGAVAIEVKNLNVWNSDGARVIGDLSFSVREGEVLGIAGLMGSGRTELLMAVFGGWDGRVSGSVSVGGVNRKITSPADAIRNGLALVTEDRKGLGLVLGQTVRENISLASLKIFSSLQLMLRRKENRVVAETVSGLKIKTHSTEADVSNLSGGNQQKVVFGKWMLTSPKILFLDEPTRGIDVGAKQEIYQEIARLAQTGVAIVLVSSELPEVIGLSHRVIVMREGGLAEELNGDQITPEAVIAAAALPA